VLGAAGGRPARGRVISLSLLRGAALLLALGVAFVCLVHALSPPASHGILVLAASVAVFKAMNRFEPPRPVDSGYNPGATPDIPQRQPTMLGRPLLDDAQEHAQGPEGALRLSGD